MGSSARVEQTGSYEIDPDIREDAIRMLRTGATVQQATPKRTSFEESQSRPLSPSWVQVGRFLRESSRGTIDQALNLFGRDIHMSSEEGAVREFSERLGQLKKMNYPVGEYGGLNPFQLYAHFVCLRGELKRRYQHTR